MVLDAFKEGDEAAVQIVEYVCKRAGKRTVCLCGSGRSGDHCCGRRRFKAGQPLIDCIRKYYQEYAFAACKTTPIVLARLGNDAGIYGAARMVIREN